MGVPINTKSFFQIYNFYFFIGASIIVPQIEQVFVNSPSGWSAPDLERRLYMARRRVEKELEADEDFYVACLSNFVTIFLEVS